MNSFRLPLLVAMLFTLCACSYESAYNGIQQSNRIACQDRPPSQYEECIESTKVTYEEYERQRKEVDGY